ncbi:alpha/beta hydrolase [Jannaschia sp. R86511]|uniref:alpha/beta hydrolase n=1 Tax=Jannaschia sp. R86511 TaxID=3093853 RepID=UPI0036D34FF7
MSRATVTTPVRPRRLRGLALGVGVAVAIGGCSLVDGEGTAAPSPADASVTAAPEPDLGPFYEQTVQWGGCEDVDAPEGVSAEDHECATLEVPLDYEDPAGERLEIALTRLPATGDRLGSLVVNPGGPGGSGVDYALQAAFVTSDELRAAYDVVGFDPRGVARSGGVDCLDDAAYDEFAAADPSPDDTAELVELERLSGALADGCADDPVAPYVDTVSATRDMDVLRAALGDSELTYLGKSYGTVLGAMYAELFPDRTGRMVLDGAVDLTPREASDLQTAIEQARGFEVAMESFVADCLQQEDCPLTGTVEDGVSQVQGLLAALETAPLPTPDPDRPVGQGLGLFALIGPLYQYDLWPALRQGLAGALAGDGEVLLLINDLFAEREPDGSYRNNAGEAIYAVNCVDGGADPGGLQELGVEDYDELADVLAEEAPTFGPQLAYGGLPCLSWPHDPVAWPEIDGAGAGDIVVVGTTRDPATPAVWAERLAEQLESGVLVTFDGDGHTAYGQTGAGCVDSALDAYLVEGTVPEDGLVCPAEY